MRQIIFYMNSSLDGYIADKDGSIAFAVYNDQVANNSHAMHKQADTVIYGHTTYNMMRDYWTQVDPDNTEEDPHGSAHAKWLQNATKIVVSSTLESTDWADRIIGKDLEAEIKALKAEEGQDIWLLASATLAHSLMKLHLIDEYRINVNSVILGSGQLLFSPLDEKIDLQLLETEVFDGGVVHLRYIDPLA